MTKLAGAFFCLVLVFLAASIFQPETIFSATGVANKTIQVVSSTGTVLNGTASATTGVANETVNVVDSTGHIIDTFGGGSGNVPNGSPPQVVGYAAANTAEADTVTGDFTLTRAGANSYTASVASTHLSSALPVNQGGTGSTTGALLGAASTNSNVFGIGFDFIGTPTASMVEALNLAFTISVPANYTTPTSTCSCGTNPSETDAYTVKCNGTSQGTFSLSTSCVLTLPTNSAYTCTAGQRLEMDAPATVSGKDIACTIVYTR